MDAATAQTFDELATLKAAIMTAGETITGALPSANAVHNARNRLYAIAASAQDRSVVETLSRDKDVQTLSRRIFPISCRAGVDEECTIADTLLTDPHLTFGKIYRRYYGETYQTLMLDELAWLETEGGLSIKACRIAYIGGGALPLPAMLMAQRTGCRITVVDPDARSCALAKALIERVGLDHLIDFACMGGQDFDYESYDLAWMANWIMEKRAIFARLQRFPNLQYIVARSAAANSLSFIINDTVDQCKICDSRLMLLHEVPHRRGLSLVSLILRRESRVSCPSRIPAKLPPRRIVDCMTDLIGNTPMLRLDPAKTGLVNIDLYAKLEHLNPFGSIKDRTALGMLGTHIRQIAADGKDVLELSSGNAARGLQAIASIHGARLETVSNRIRIAEMRKMLQIQGAKITPIENIDNNDAYAALNFVDGVASMDSNQYYYTDQYRNPANDGTHYGETGREIAEDLGRVDFFIGAVGTAGSTVGISRRLREDNPALDVTGVVSSEDDFVPGIRHKDEIFNVGAFAEKHYDRLIDISGHDSIDGVLDLVRLYGVMGGPSSGATYLAALKHLRAVDATLTRRHTAVFVVFDRLDLYLSYFEERRPDIFEA